MAATSTGAVGAPVGVDDPFGVVEADGAEEPDGATGADGAEEPDGATGAAGADGAGAGAALAWPKIADTIFPRTLMKCPPLIHYLKPLSKMRPRN